MHKITLTCPFCKQQVAHLLDSIPQYIQPFHGKFLHEGLPIKTCTTVIFKHEQTLVMQNAMSSQEYVIDLTTH